MLILKIDSNLVRLEVECIGTISSFKIGETVRGREHEENVAMSMKEGVDKEGVD